MENARPQRIVILGNAGAGKSTLATRLGTIYELPVYHLDRLFWKPGWVESERHEFDARVLAVAATDRWVIDGNYTRTLQARIDRADMIVYINVSRYRALYRVIRRSFRYWGQTRSDMGDDCPDHLDPAFLAFVWNYPKRRGAEHPQMLAQAKSVGKHVVVLKAGKEVTQHVDKLASVKETLRSEITH
jgi:adenylate kinase family enzyme